MVGGPHAGGGQAAKILRQQFFVHEQGDGKIRGAEVVEQLFKRIYFGNAGQIGAWGQFQILKGQFPADQEVFLGGR